jgi:hypothetical protein
MKVQIEIDCTPEEARTFFGLPDLGPLHEAWLARMQTMATEGPSAADFEKMTRAWMPGMADGLEQWRQMMLAAMPKPPQ